MGPENRYLSLIYGVSDYDQVFANRTPVSMSALGHRGEGVTNESLTMHYQAGINLSDTLLVSVRYSNIGPMLDLGGEKQKGISDTYIGWKRNTRFSRISQGYELGVLIPASYTEESITSPGTGTEEFHLSWHWAKAYSPKSSLLAKMSMKLKSSDIPHSLAVDLRYQRLMGNGFGSQILFSMEDSFGSVNLFDTSSGWPAGTQTAYHLKDEYQQFIGLSLFKNIGKDLQVFWLGAHKLSGKNTDRSRISHSIGLGWRF